MFAAFGRVVEDVYRDRGPLGGIHAALSSSATELNLMLAVDLPFVDRSFWSICFCVHDNRVQWLRSRGRIVACSRFARFIGVDLRKSAEQSLRDGKNKIDSLFERVGTCVIEEEELAQAGFSAEIFQNLNTPQELEKARSLDSGRRR